MNSGSLNERITRALAFMLRHQPEEFDLELDRFGWGDLEDVIYALQERIGSHVEDEDVEGEELTPVNTCDDGEGPKSFADFARAFET